MTASVDLNALYGVDTIALRQEFSSGPDATRFIKDYCLNENKQVKVISSGRVKKYHCPNVNCDWLVVCTKSKAAPFCFRISSLKLTHADACIVAARSSGRQIANLPEFRVAVASDSTTSPRALIATAQATSRIPLHNRKATLYRAKEAVLVEHAGDYEDSYTLIPSLLRELKEANPGSTIALERDQEGRFFHAFICLAGTVQCLPFGQRVYVFDGAHFKQSKYTGVVLTLLARDGDNHNFPVAFALVSSENEANVAWFIRLCVEAGVPLMTSAPSPPLFCDRGVLLHVASALESEATTALNLKYCSIYIIRNIKRNFSVSRPRLDDHIWTIQGATSTQGYEVGLSAMKKDYGEGVEKYVRDIPPEKWTVHGSPCKLYGWRTTNFVKSHNSVLDKNGLRRDSPLQAIKTRVKAAMVAISKRSDLYAQWTRE